MKTQYKLKDHVTREWLTGTKWDQSSWKNDEKQVWQEEVIKLGFNWCCATTTHNLNEDIFYLNKPAICKLCPSISLEWSEGVMYRTLFFWEDMFEPIPQESPQPIEANVVPSQYNYVKKDYTLASEALRDFEKGIELYYNVVGGDTFKTGSEGSVLSAWVDNNLYTKVETPWHDRVNPENPVFVLYEGNIRKVTTLLSNGALLSEEDHCMSKNDCKPLTDEVVNDIVQTMKKFNGG